MIKKFSLFPFLCFLVFCFNLINVFASKHSIVSSEKNVSQRRNHQMAQQTLIYFPEKEIQSILDIEKEGIFVSLKEYQDLYSKAKIEYEKQAIENTGKGDLKDPLIVQAQYAGSIEGEILSFSVNYKIVSNGDSPQIFNIPLKGVGFRKASLNGKKVLIYQKESQPKVVIPRQGSFDLKIDFFVPIQYNTHNNRKLSQVSFSIPKAIFSHVKISSDLFFNVSIRDVLFKSKEQVANKMEYFAFLGEAEKLSFEITNRRSIGDKKIQISSNEKHQIFLTTDFIEQNISYDLDINNGEIGEIDAIISKNIHIKEVTGNGIAGWRRKKGLNHDFLHIKFYVPLSGKIHFSLHTYKYLDLSHNFFEVNDVLLSDLFKRRGKLQIFYDENIRIDTKEISHLQPSWGARTILKEIENFSLYKEYQIFNLPYEITLSSESFAGAIEMRQNNIMTLEKEKFIFHSKILLSSLKQGTSQFIFTSPENYRLKNINVSVNGHQIKEDHIQDNENNRLKINIRRAMSSKDEITFIIDYEQNISEEKLGKTSEEIPIPILSFPDASKVDGSLQIVLDGAFLMHDIALKGYVPAEGMIRAQTQGKIKKNLIYNYRSMNPEGHMLLSMRSFEKTSTTITYMTVDQDLLQANIFLKYNIGAGEENSFYFAIPHWEGSKINIEGNNIKEKKKISLEKNKNQLIVPDNITIDGYDIWNVILQKEMTQTYDLNIDFQKKIEQFETPFNAPLIIPLDVINDTGYIVLESSKNTEIISQKAGLHEVENYEIPQWAKYQPSNRIIESLRYFTQPFSYSMAIRRMNESSLLAAIAEKESISYVFGANSYIFFENNYLIRNTNMQFLEIKLPKNFIFWGATIQGQGIKPRKGEKNQLYIPLPIDNDQNINLRITGQIQQNTRLNIFKNLKINSLQLNIPILESDVSVYYPGEYSLMRIKGNLNQLPVKSGETPFILSFLRNIMSSSISNISNILMPSHLKRRRGGMAEYSETQYEPYYSKSDYSVSKEKSGGRGGKLKNYKKGESPQMKTVDGLAPAESSLMTDRKIQMKGRGESVLNLEKYKKKKGILSLNIKIPKEGNYLSAHKLWGNSALHLTFISDTIKKILSLVCSFFVILLGFHVTKRKIFTPFMFLVMILAFSTLIPLVIFSSYVFLFNGAALGAFLFIFIIGFRFIYKKRNALCRSALVIIFVLLSSAPLTEMNAWAKEHETFPHIKAYIPYKDGNQEDLNNSKEIYIPAEDYFHLKNLAQPPYQEPKDILKYDDEYNVSSMNITGTVDDDKASFRGLVNVHVNTDQWVLVELPFSNVFIESLKLDGKSIPVKVKQLNQNVIQKLKQKTLVSHPNIRDIYQIPILGFGEHSIELIFHSRIQALLGKKTLFFGCPNFLVSDFSLNLKNKDIFVEMERLGAFLIRNDEIENTIIQASLSGKKDIRLSWFPKKYLKKEEKPLIYADCIVNMQIDYDNVNLHQKIKILIEKSSIPSISFLINPEMEIVDVLSNKVKEWTIRSGKTELFLDVIFKHEISDILELEIIAKADVLPNDLISVMFLHPQETHRIRGNLNLFSSNNSKLEITNILNLNASPLDSAFTHHDSPLQIQKSYSFLNGSFSADIKRIPEEKKVYANISTKFIFSNDLLTSIYEVSIDIKKNPLTEIRIIIPDGHKISSLTAENTSDYILKKNILKIPLQMAVQNKYKFHLVLEKELRDFMNAEIEGIRILDMQKIKGTAEVIFPRGFDVKEKLTSGLKSSNFKRDDFENPLRNEAQVTIGAQYAYKIHSKTFNAKYEVSEKKASLDVVKIYHSTVKDNLVNVKLLSILNIKNAPLDHFDIIVPSFLRDAIDVEGDGIKTILKKNINGGKNSILTVKLFSAIDNAYLLQLSFNKYFDHLKTFTMPEISFSQAENKTEFISVEADTIYSLKLADTKALIDFEADAIPALPNGVELNNILWSFIAPNSSPWKFGLKLTRLQREKLITANILREDIKSIIIPDGFLLNEIHLKVNNRSLQFLPIQIPKGASIWSVKVAGESVRASNIESDNADSDKYLIPLIKSGAGDRSFRIKLLYLMPIKKLGLFGKIDLGMLKVKDSPTEKTTWSVFVPENYQISNFKTNMQEIDLSMIEAEKTLELAKEYKYWTSLAGSAKGELRQKALDNRSKVMGDITTQSVVNEQMQTDLDSRKGNKKFDQGLIKEVKSQNTQILQEATEIINSNQAPSRVHPIKKLPRAAIKDASKRRNLKGWQFKTKNIRGGRRVEKSIENYIHQEDQRQVSYDEEFREQESQQRSREIYSFMKRKKKRDIGQSEYWGSDSNEENDDFLRGDIFDFQNEAPASVDSLEERLPQEGETILRENKNRTEVSKSMAVDASAIAGGGTAFRQSVLLKGRRSIDIPLPETGRRYSFKKLGGDPQLKFAYRKGRWIFKLFLLLLGIIGIIIIKKFSHYSPPIGRWLMSLKKINVIDIFYWVTDSMPLKVLTLISILPTFFLQSPLSLVLLGLISVFLIRMVSLKRYKKMGYVPAFSFKTFLKYLFSFIIFTSTICLFIHRGFFLPLGIATSFNYGFFLVYSIITIGTKNKMKNNF